MTGARLIEFDPARIHQLRLLLLASGGRLAAIVDCLAELKIADELVDKPLTSAELAERVGANPNPLDRVLRAASAIGLFDVDDEDRFELTDLSLALVADRPDSIRALVRYSGAEFVRLPYQHLSAAVRTGESAMQAATGGTIWQHLSNNPAQGEFFDDMMRQMSGRMIGRYTELIHHPEFRRIADIGAGTGTFLRSYLRQDGQATAVLVERPEVLSVAAELAASDGLADRLELFEADIFVDPLPADCDAYVLMTVLHNWSDDRVAQLLANVRSACGDRDVRLFVCEQVLRADAEWDFGRLLDIDMLLLFGGAERTGAEWQQVLATAGFEVVGPTPAPGWTVIECRPV